MDGEITVLGLDARKQQTAHAVGLLEAAFVNELVPQEGPIAGRLMRQQGKKAGTERCSRRDGVALHHAGIAGHILAEVIENPQILFHQRGRQGRRINLRIQNLAGLVIVSCLGIQVAQRNGSLVIAVMVPNLEGQGLGVFQVNLRGVKAEREIVGGSHHGQLVTAGGIQGGRYQPAVSAELVALFGHIEFAGGQEAVQLVQQFLYLSVGLGRRHTGDSQGGRHQ